MPNDMYERYRKPLTQEELEGMPEAQRKSALMAEEAAKPDGRLRRVANGYEQKADGVFLPDAVTTEYMGIAMERAEAQFEGWPVMPEDESVALRFPGIDPVKKYSIIDMKVAQRVAQINAMLESRSPEVKAYAGSLLELVSKNPVMRDINLNMKLSAEKHRTVSRAAKLCLDEAGRELLKQEARILESSNSVMQVDLFLQGAEYASGVRTGPVPQEVQEFYAKQLQMPLNMERIKEAETLDHTPREVKVEFQNLEHKLQQELFADPNNWGKTPSEVAKEGIPAVRVEQTISPYARATAARVIDPLFKGAEEISGDKLTFNRAENIIVGGKTVKEKMFEDYVASGNDPSEFIGFFTKNYRQMTNEYVAGALMSGQRVEAFVPDKDGRIPNEPVQITKTGYEPSPLNPVVLNGWERFWSKLGFFKEKVMAAVEYQRTVEARERVKSTNVLAQIERTNGSTPLIKNMFFADWKEKNGPLPTSVPNGYSASRTALPTMAVCYMAAQGYDIKDIYDPNRLQAEKLQIGTEVMNRMLAGDQKWAGEVLFHGQRAIMDQTDRYCRQINILDNNQLLNGENSFLFNATLTAFDAAQEVRHCKSECQAAAERYAPGNDEQAVIQVINRASTVGDFFERARLSLRACNKLAGGMANINAPESDVVQPILNFEAARTAYGTKMAAAPDAPVSSHFTIESMGATYASYYSQVMDTPAAEKLADQLRNPNGQKDFARSMFNGQAQKRMHIHLDENNFLNCSFGFDAPSKQEQLDQSREREMQAFEQKNQPKPMGGGRAK